jgi:alpha-mannosidase
LDLIAICGGPKSPAARGWRAVGLRLSALSAAVLLLFLSASAENPFGRKMRTLEERVNPALDRWEAAVGLTQDQALDPSFRPSRPQMIGAALFWRGNRTVWLRARLTFPERLAGVPLAGGSVSLVCDVQDRGEIFVDGVSRAEFLEWSGEVVLVPRIKPGRTVFIVLKITNPGSEKGWFRSARLVYSPLAEVRSLIHAQAETAAVIEALEPWLPTPPETIRTCVAEAAAAVDEAALDRGRGDEFARSLARSRRALLPLSAALKTFRFLLLAYSHIDLAWFWTKDEAENVIWKKTSEVMLDALAEHPGLVYAAGQMHAYRWMERDYPALFVRIQEAVRSGRWEPVGGQWVESDGNLPSGESFVRQFLYGRKYSLEKFGRASTLAFLPDTFGFHAQLPQILAKSDMRGFLTWRLQRMDTTPFPYRLFWWQAPDGSRVLAHVVAGRYDDAVFPGRMAGQMAEMRRLHGAADDLVLFGKGDHGSGIPRDYYERAEALRADPLFPRLEFATAESAFDAYARLGAERPFPIWNDELYLQSFRGIYTTQARAKENNRRNEIRLGSAEAFSSVASLAAGRPYPAGPLEESWKNLLFNQFHDILPGTAVAAVYRDEQADSARIAAEATKQWDEARTALAARADTSGPGRPLLLFNGLSWPRGGLVEVPLAAGSAPGAGPIVFDERDRVIPAQIVAAENAVRTLLFNAAPVPAGGFAVYHLRDDRPVAPPAGGVTVSGLTLENEFLRLTIDAASGWVTEIWDKRSGRDVTVKGRPAFELQAYAEIFGSDGWELVFRKDPSGIMPPPASRIGMPAPSRVWVSESGPVRASISIERSFGQASKFCQTISLVRGIPVVYGIVDADWRDTYVFLKCAFPLAVDADRATYEIPYGALDRASSPRTDEERAKWEVPGHRWADLTDRSGRFGASLLSYSKYGYDARNNVLRLTLLRSTTAPAPDADLGRHRIALALYPHSGGWEAGETSRRGAEYNDPLAASEVSPHPGAWGRARSFFSASPANVHLTALKRSEDGRAWIVRVVNWSRRSENAGLSLPASPRAVFETNLVERILRPWPADGSNGIRFPIGPQEIKTFRLEFRDSP